jgi:hypothetical protein
MSHALLKRSLEAVDYQTEHMLFTELTQAIEFLRTDLKEDGAHSSKKDRKEAVADSEINKIIERNTGIKANINIVDDDTAYVYPPRFDRNHIFMYRLKMVSPDELEKDLSKQSKKKRKDEKPELMEGEIDFKNGRVSGDFATVNYHIGVGINLVAGHGPFFKLEPAHVAAILIHEIGHIFTFIEHLRFTSTVTHTLHEVAQIQRETKNESERLALARKRQLNRHIDEETLEKALEPGEESKSFLITVQAQQEDPTSILNSKHYDSVQSEAVADQFAVRMGAGQYITEALDVLHKAMGSTYNSRIGALFSSIFISIIQVVVLFLLYGVYGPAFWFLFGLVFVTYLLMDISTGGDLVYKVYDTIDKRFERIRKDLIQVLKDDGLSDEARADIKEQLEAVEEVQGSTFFNSNLLGKIFDQFPSLRKTRNQEQFINRVEDITHNEFFRHANDFKVDFT